MLRSEGFTRYRAFVVAFSVAAAFFAASLAQAEEPVPQDAPDPFPLEAFLEGQAEPLEDGEIAEYRGQGGQGDSKTLGLMIKEDPNRRIGASSGIDPTSMPKRPPGNVPWFRTLP